MAKITSDTLFEAVDILIDEKLSSVKFDNTILCTIESIDNEAGDEYTVTDGNTSFTAYGDTGYKANTNVYVLIPGGDYNNKKVIVGKYVSSDTESFTYVSPMDSFLQLTGNLFADVKDSSNNNCVKTEHGLVANLNLPTNAKKENIKNQEWLSALSYTGNNLVCNSSYPVTLKHIGALDSINAKFSIGYDRLGLSAQFRTNLSNYRTISGTYGLLLWVVWTSKAESTNEVTTHNSFLTLDTADMWGNPYNFETYFTQEKVFDIRSVHELKSMNLYFYQKNDFLDSENSFIPHATTLQEGSLFVDEEREQTFPDNLFVTNMNVVLGHDISDVTTDKVYLYTSDSEEYSPETAVNNSNVEREGRLYAEDYPHEGNAKRLFARWIHKTGTSSVIAIDEDDELPTNCQVHWYRYRLDKDIEDANAGMFWEEITPYTALGYINLNGNAHDGGYYHGLNTIFLPDAANFQNEQLKIIIIETDFSELETIEEKYSVENKEALQQEITELEIAIAAATKQKEEYDITMKNGGHVDSNDYDNADKTITTKTKTLTAKQLIYGAWEENKSKEIDEKAKTKYTSDILTFKNTATVANNATVKLVKDLAITCTDSFSGVYKIYNPLNGELMNAAEHSKTRQAKVSFKSILTGTDELDKAETVSWYIPRHNTMIVPPQEGIEYNLTDKEGNPADTFDNTNEDYYIITRQFTGAKISSDIGAMLDRSSVQYYRIDDYFNENKNNNLIKCIVYRNTIPYEASKELAFGLSGSNGRDSTLILGLGNDYDANGNLLEENVPAWTLDMTTEYSMVPTATAQENGILAVWDPSTVSTAKYFTIAYNQKDDNNIETEVYSDTMNQEEYMEYIASYETMLRNKYAAIIEEYEQSLAQVSLTEADRAKEILKKYEQLLAEKENYTFKIKELVEEAKTIQPTAKLELKAKVFDYNNQELEITQLTWSPYIPNQTNSVFTIVQQGEYVETYDTNATKKAGKHYYTKESASSYTMIPDNAEWGSDVTVYERVEIPYIKLSQADATAEVAILRCDALAGGKTYSGYLSIPLRRNRRYTYMEGATSVLYNSQGASPTYYKDYYQLYDADEKPITSLSVCRIETGLTAEQVKWLPKVKITNGKYYLNPNTMYLDNIDYNCTLNLFQETNFAPCTGTSKVYEAAWRKKSYYLCTTPEKYQAITLNTEIPYEAGKYYYKDGNNYILATTETAIEGLTYYELIPGVYTLDTANSFNAEKAYYKLYNTTQYDITTQQDKVVQTYKRIYLGPANTTFIYSNNNYYVFTNGVPAEVTAENYEPRKYYISNNNIYSIDTSEEYSNTKTYYNCAFELASGDYNPSLIYYYPNDEIWLWRQPVLILQNRYSSPMLNNWDGSLTIDEENSTILSAMLGAGVKNSDNTFSGVLLGNVNLADDGVAQTGVYGYDHGEMSYGLKQDGTAFIGKNSTAKLVFDGKTGTISNQGYQSVGTGIKLYLDGVSDNEQYLSLKSANIEHLRLSTISPYLTIKGEDGTIRFQVTSEKTTIGGWKVTDTYITGGNTTLYSSGEIDTKQLYAHGGGTIGGWKISDDTLSSTSGKTVLYDDGRIVCDDLTAITHGTIGPYSIGEDENGRKRLQGNGIILSGSAIYVGNGIVIKDTGKKDIIQIGGATFSAYDGNYGVQLDGSLYLYGDSIPNHVLQCDTLWADQAHFHNHITFDWNGDGASTLNGDNVRALETLYWYYVNRWDHNYGNLATQEWVEKNFASANHTHASSSDT